MVKVIDLKVLSIPEQVRNISVKSKSHKRKRSAVEDLCDNDDVKFAVMKRAEEIVANLAPQFPSMIKCMLPSFVSGGWLRLSQKFCKDHLPKEDTEIVLEDESGESLETVYHAHKMGLSGGWKKFTMMHKLSEGDVVVFHLVKPTKFKVYIVRANDSEEADGDLSHLQMEACARQMNSTNDTADRKNLSKISTEMEDQDLEHLLLDNSEEDIEKKRMVTCVSKLRPEIDQSEDEILDLGFEITDGIRVSESASIDFEEVKSFEDFDIIANGLVINSELSMPLQSKYYELCCSQKSFLHDHILEGLNCKLVAGIIVQIITIADGLRDPKLATVQEKFGAWEKILKSFQGLGMNVEFLLARLEQLMDISSKSKRHKNATFERAIAEEETRTLEARLLEAKKTGNRLDVEIQTLGPSTENLELKFQEMAKAPW
ncbi:B3 DOMAIN-CONTAINING PROTEIN [Salix koriyanagi]|uniref:B3 DOMAIN-CONTAINING PROTEIN n=1 Tax=Salix koriyanagi TaxID=2511006 RepID=A0A9Q0U3Q7_9ROSI|nr:B3 DOMAIN-CONTAINING PROTEIN [Salix koriyanagi]